MENGEEEKEEEELGGGLVGWEVTIVSSCLYTDTPMVPALPLAKNLKRKRIPV